MIHKVDDASLKRSGWPATGEPPCFVISSYDTWRPGAYESERAARYAFRFDDEVLKKLQDSVRPGVITYKMLKETAAALKRKP